MSSLKQETKIGKSRVGVSVALALTPGSRARSGMCVLCFFDFLTFTYSSHLSLSLPALYPLTLRGCHHSH